MPAHPLLVKAAQHTAQARAINDEFEGKPMPAEAATQMRKHLDMASDYRKRVEREVELEDTEAWVKDPQSLYKHDMSNGGSAATGGFSGGGAFGDEDLAKRDRLRKNQSVADWMAAKGLTGSGEGDLDLGLWLRGALTGNWQNAEAERAAFTKDQSEGTAGSGGVLVPTPLSGQLIDMARNASVVFRAGAQVVPMTSQTLKVPRLIGEGAPAWRSENAAITSADLSFDAVTFTARSLNRLVKCSVELFEDADPSAGSVIAKSFAGQIAAEIDRAALRGSGTAPEPRGVLNTSGITTTTHGANGTSISTGSPAPAYDWLLDAVGTVRGSNFEPNAHIVAPRTVTNLSKVREASTFAYLAPPESMLPMLTTKNVPINLTVGTSADCSEIYTGQWDSLLVGIRTQFRIEVLRERFADTGEIAFLAWFRGDCQLAQPSAFAVDTGVRP